MMKRFLSVLLLLSMLIFAFTACENSPATEDGANRPQTSASDNIDSNGNSNDPSDNANVTPPPAVLTNEEKYNNAVALIAEGKYTQAYKLLSEIKTYAPAQEKLKHFFYAPKTVTEKWKYSGDTNYHTRSTTYTYNATGNILETSDGDIFAYDADGNILRGRDLVWGTYYVYTYQDGKLHTETGSDDVSTYYYNEKGLISKIERESTSGNDETVYAYTYYANGAVKTMIETEDDGEVNSYSYDQNGALTEATLYDGECSVTWTYGAYGITKIDANLDDWMDNRCTYTYDQNGILTKLEAKGYEDGQLDAEFLITFSDHQLCYSENHAVQDRIAVVCYTELTAALEIIW